MRYFWGARFCATRTLPSGSSLVTPMIYGRRNTTALLLIHADAAVAIGGTGCCSAATTGLLGN